MNKLFSNDAWNDYLYWQKFDKTKLKRINKLILSIEREGYSKGIGKPEPLKHDLSSYWSRRINEEHQLIYKINENNIMIASCKDHY
ncbi:Txe/YoeB family addiction module toxin [Clostridiaceae bacterium HSG29]|nr:Txe/YoeB family addiction module toxin [Clostridiaceae bacterium HSG29]